MNTLREWFSDQLKDAAIKLAPKYLRRDAELGLLQSLPPIRYEDEFIEPGVLLSDRIKHLAEKHQLIEPFNLAKLKPAAYELSVGGLYSISGITNQLIDIPGNNEIVIPPFEVVVIQTLERLNVPDFLIARWNVRVRWAYQGLLWVGAAQVDPGYRGFLCCPLYNLSDTPVRLHYGEEIAVIDFVTTTSPLTQPVDQKYKPLKRTRLLFEDYSPDKLRSALATQAKERIDDFEKQIEEFRNRLDLLVGVTFTAIGVLAAAAAVFATKALPDSANNFTPALLVGTAAITIALLSCVYSYGQVLSNNRKTRIFVVMHLLVIALLTVLVVQSFRIAPWRTDQIRTNPTTTPHQ